jgi:IclR family pca regulon transcriptional regulator
VKHPHPITIPPATHGRKDGLAGRGTSFVQSLERGLAVIRSFDELHAELTLSDVARATGLSRATARRFLHTLVDLGYVHERERHFALRPKVLDLGFAYLSSLTLPRVAQPHLEALVQTTQESSSVSVLDGDSVVYVARVATRRIMTVSIAVGTRFPAYATSMGRVLLAAQTDDWLDGYLASATLRRLTPRTLVEPDALRHDLLTIRAQGWSLVDEELEEGLRAIAVPIRDHRGAVIAAMNVSAPTRRGPSHSLQAEFLPILLTAAADIEADLRSIAIPRVVAIPS